MGIDLKKEIKLSDLVKRKHKAASPEETASSLEAAPTDGPKPDLMSLMRRARSSAPQEPKAEKAPKAKGAKAPRHDHEAQHELPLMRAFNLLPREDPREARSVRPRAPQLVLAIVGIILIAGSGAAYTVMSATVEDKRTTRDEVRAQVEALRQQIAASGQEEIDPALVSEKNLRTYALASALSGRVAWDRLLREVSLVTPEDVWLSGLAAIPAETADAVAGESSLTVNGYTHGQEGVARMLARLAVVPELSAVQLVSSASSLIGDTEVVQFSISAGVKLPGGASA